jgi:hypothetical protein
MFNPPDFNKNENSYINLRKRIFHHLLSDGVHEQIHEIVKNAYAKALREEGLVLTRVESARLQAQILQDVLDEASKGHVGD